MSKDTRTIAKRMPDGWYPPVPAWSALPREHGMRIAYYGVQSAAGKQSPAVLEFRGWFLSLLAQDGAPQHCEYAEFVDPQGYYTWLVVAYWLQVDDFQRWSDSPAHQDYWLAAQRLTAPAGVFREVLQVPSERFETLQSNAEERAGAAKVCPVLHGPIREHNYWGGMRDRIARSAVDPLQGEAIAPAYGGSTATTEGRRIRVSTPHNLAVIRSGQAFADLHGEERTLYETRIEPALRDGLHYLATEGHETGCLSSRLLRETDAQGQVLPRTFGLVHFQCLQHMEDWARSHPTHLRIYGEFLAMAKTLEGQLNLRLWHEVAVLPASDQHFEYLNCHPATGLLGLFADLHLHAPGVQA